MPKKELKQKFTQRKSFKVFIHGLWKDNPIFCMILGICSALAVTNKVENALAMGLGVTFVLIFSGLFISALRAVIPGRVRMIAYMVIIATFVIVVDQFLKAFFPEISEAMGPYVGLIITNCIIMGRAEAFAIKNGLRHTVLDGLGCGLGYTGMLLLMSVIREPLGFGTLLGFGLLPTAYTKWTIMIIAPGAFFLLGSFLWIFRTAGNVEEVK